MHEEDVDGEDINDEESKEPEDQGTIDYSTRVRTDEVPSLGPEAITIVKNIKELISAWRKMSGIDTYPQTTEKILKTCDHRLTNEDLEDFRDTGKLINVGFPQCKTIIMPLIPVYCSSVPLSLVVSIAFTVLCDVLSAPQFPVDLFSLIVHAEFEVGILTP
ncbi:unnamed protein product [Porites evermanni]|uniref:Uncharacterized protein n=1 Tax=Porites evermanni TaxID=104178 RepID=A0ABN8RVA0_9CNID|nr:unnamed protein product [Porites evermanni]